MIILGCTGCVGILGVAEGLGPVLGFPDSVGRLGALTKPTALFADICRDFEEGVLGTAVEVRLMTWMV